MSRCVVALVAASILVGACSSGARTAVRTNNGGLLDCTSQTVEYFQMDYGPDTEGATSAASALLVLEPDTGRPPGDPQVESEREDAAIFLFADDDQNRLGRVLVVRFTNGWVVRWAERCG